MAIVINRPLGERSMASILQAFGEKAPDVSATVPVYLGGPVQLEMSTVLHSAEYRRNGTFDIDGHVAVTASMADYDLAIIGGGINGAGIARDAAGRGLRVLLLEQHDLGSGTSSASTKLIHGGLRYLEQGWFRLVREALIEREVMLRMAPHLIRPMRFMKVTVANRRRRAEQLIGTGDRVWLSFPPDAGVVLR